MPAARTRQLTTAALLTALLAASAYVTIPTQPVPITFQLLVVILAALLLEPTWAFASVGAYVLLGAVGLPVFAGARGGPGVLLGPTGGYLSGFVVGATVAALFHRRVRGRWRPAVADGAAALVVVAIVYLFGWAQLRQVTGVGSAAAFATGVAPFLLLDLLKAAAAVGIAGALRRAGVAPE